MMRYHYHEKLAAKLNGCNVEQLFEKKRKPEVVLARMFCLKYQEEVIGISQWDNSGRFDMEHAIVSHSCKTMDDRMFTEPKIRSNYQEFLGLCKAHREEEEAKRNGTSVINFHGFSAFIKIQIGQFEELIDTLEGYMEDEAEGDEVLTEIRKIEETIYRLKYNFTK